MPEPKTVASEPTGPIESERTGSESHSPAEDREPTPPSFPPESVLHEQHQVVESPYVPAGVQRDLDTTDAGWSADPTHEHESPPQSQVQRPDPTPQPPQPAAIPGPPTIAPPQVAADYDDLPPPTEEVPNAVLQDISQPYSAPMHVPEPPPIPGILDRFTPAGAVPRGRNQKIERRPSYIAATPTPPPMLRSLERPTAPPPIKEARPRYADDEEVDNSRRGLPILLGMMGLVALLVLALLFVLMSMYFNTSQEAGTPVAEQPVPTVQPVAPVEPEPTTSDRLENPDTDAAAVPVPAEPVVEPKPPVPAASPAPVRPRPVRPAPVSPPDPVPEPVAELGTLKIRSNRRVMVTVNGKAIGYTPRTYKAKSGTISVSAMIPRQPQSKQTQTVAVRNGQTKSVDFTF